MKESIRAVWLPVAAGLAGLVAVPATAQIAPSGEWQYAEAPENCRAYRSFGVGESRVLLQLRTFGPGSAVEAMVVSSELPDDPNSVRPVELSWDGQPAEREQSGILGSVGGVPTITMLFAHRPTASFGFLYEGTYAWFTRVARNVRLLRLRVVGDTPIELQTGSLEEPLARLEQCEANLMDKWGWGADYSQRVVTPPEMLDPQSWFYRGIVYPAVQNLKRVSSILQLRLKVGADGKVADCVVQSSPGSSLFGSKNCAGLRKASRFNPATDSQGQPVESYMQLSITFTRYD